MITDLNQLADEFHRQMTVSGFNDYTGNEDLFIADQTGNMHGEIQELFDAYRAGTLHSQCDKNIGLTCEEEEVADIIYRALNFARVRRIDIVRALNIKHAYNKTRPFRHGKKN